MENKLVYFILTHSEDLIKFQSDVFRPFLTGAANKSNKNGFLTDSTGENIAYKNNNYAELTAYYWVWKNFLKDNPNIEYIGFCHYRRIIDFSKNNNILPYKEIPLNEFQKLFNTEIYSEDYIYNKIKDYDITLPKKKPISPNIEAQYKEFHPIEPFEKVNEIIKRDYPKYTEILDEFWKKDELYACLNHVMKKEIFVEFCEWIFDIMPKLEQECDLTGYKTYYSEKVIAYLTERLINVFIEYKIRNDGIKIQEKDSYQIRVDDKYYNFGILKVCVNLKRIYFNLLGIKLSFRRKTKDVQ